MNYKEITVKKDIKTHRVFSKGYKNLKGSKDSVYDGVTLSRGAIYLVEKNTGFGSGKYDLIVRAGKRAKYTWAFESIMLVNSKDVVFLNGKGI